MQMNQALTKSAQRNVVIIYGTSDYDGDKIFKNLNDNLTIVKLNFFA